MTDDIVYVYVSSEKVNILRNYQKLMYFYIFIKISFNFSIKLTQVYKFTNKILNATIQSNITLCLWIFILKLNNTCICLIGRRKKENTT